MTFNFYHFRNKEVVTEDERIYSSHVYYLQTSFFTGYLSLWKNGKLCENGMKILETVYLFNEYGQFEVRYKIRFTATSLSEHKFIMRIINPDEKIMYETTEFLIWARQKKKDEKPRKKRKLTKEEEEYLL